jgi:hypothetical protein
MGSRVYSAIKTDGTMLSISTNMMGMLDGLSRAIGDRELFIVVEGERVHLDARAFRKARDANKAKCSKDYKKRMKKLADEFEYDLAGSRFMSIWDSGIPVYLAGCRTPALYLRDDNPIW